LIPDIIVIYIMAKFIAVLLLVMKVELKVRRIKKEYKEE